MWLLQKMFEKCSFLEENNKEYGIYFQQGGRRPSILHASAPPLWAQRGVLVCLGCALAPKEKKKQENRTSTEPPGREPEPNQHQNPLDENPTRAQPPDKNPARITISAIHQDSGLFLCECDYIIHNLLDLWSASDLRYHFPCLFSDLSAACTSKTCNLAIGFQFYRRGLTFY